MPVLNTWTNNCWTYKKYILNIQTTHFVWKFKNFTIAVVFHFFPPIHTKIQFHIFLSKFFEFKIFTQIHWNTVFKKTVFNKFFCCWKCSSYQKKIIMKWLKVLKKCIRTPSARPGRWQAEDYCRSSFARWRSSQHGSGQPYQTKDNEKFNLCQFLEQDSDLFLRSLPAIIGRNIGRGIQNFLFKNPNEWLFHTTYQQRYVSISKLISHLQFVHEKKGADEWNYLERFLISSST